MLHWSRVVALRPPWLVQQLMVQHDVHATQVAACAAAGKNDIETTNTGMLVVESVVPGSGSDGKLESGDVLVRISGHVVAHFLSVEELLDEAVGQEVEVVIERAGKPVRKRASWPGWPSESSGSQHCSPRY